MEDDEESDPPGESQEWKMWDFFVNEILDNFSRKKKKIEFLKEKNTNSRHNATICTLGDNFETQISMEINLYN